MQLRAGKLSMIYENGFLRTVSAGNEEVLSMIYFAVRDPAWDTIPSEMTQEEITQQADSFRVVYTRIFNHGDIQMNWQVRIEGLASSEIHFEIKGQVLSSFQKNRVGFCLLHPIKECAGNEVMITHTDGRVRNYTFPLYISPYQPFKDIASMQWTITHAYAVNIHLKGDIFEMEDQRNWTDNSFKTYCTPLALPFPAWMQKGEEVHQSIHLSLVPSPLPAIGIGRSAVRNKNYPAGLEILSRIGFSHYRADLRLSDPGWPQTLSEVMEESEHLKAPLEIALFMTDEKALQKFLETEIKQSDLKHIVLLQEGMDCIGNPFLTSILPLLRERFPGVPIGAGTDSHFTELNRSDLSADGLDFVSYSIHPQVHAFDDASLMENAAAQQYTVHTARHKYGVPIHISPITLHARNITDARLQTAFGAQWTSAGLDCLIKAGVASVTYFEALGERGIASYEKDFIPHPVMGIFKDLLADGRSSL